MAKKVWKIGDWVKLDNEGNKGIITGIVRGMALIGRGAGGSQRDLKSLTKAKAPTYGRKKK